MTAYGNAYRHSRGHTCSAGVQTSEKCESGVTVRFCMNCMNPNVAGVITSVTRRTENAAPSTGSSTLVGDTSPSGLRYTPW